MTIDWRPAACVMATAAAATAVFPEPTSPFRRRFMGTGFSRSWKTSQVALRWALVSSKPTPALNLSITAWTYRTGVAGSLSSLRRFWRK